MIKNEYEVALNSTFFRWPEKLVMDCIDFMEALKAAGLKLSPTLVGLWMQHFQGTR